MKIFKNFVFVAFFVAMVFAVFGCRNSVSGGGVQTTNGVTLTFNLDGGTGINTMLVGKPGEALVAPAAPSKTCSTFAGWEPAYCLRIFPKETQHTQQNGLVPIQMPTLLIEMITEIFYAFHVIESF